MGAVTPDQVEMLRMISQYEVYPKLGSEEEDKLPLSIRRILMKRSESPHSIDKDGTWED